MDASDVMVLIQREREEPTPTTQAVTDIKSQNLVLAVVDVLDFIDAHACAAEPTITECNSNA